MTSAYKFNYHHNKKIFSLCVLSTASYMLFVTLFALKEGSGACKILTFIIYSYLGTLIMESVEYIEHYGLVYRANEKAKPVTEISSWNTPINVISNAIGFRFERHSDHHMNAYKLYNTLDLTDKMPQFPFDFLIGALVAWLPFAWMWAVNPLVDEVLEGKKVSNEHMRNIRYFLNGIRMLLIISFFMKFL